MTDQPDATIDEQDSSPRGLRRASFVVILAGAIVSITLMFLTRQNPPTLIVWLFVVWVLGPYIAFTIGYRLARRWKPPASKALYVSTIAITFVANLVYLKDVLWPPASTRAFVWVLVPPVMGAAVVSVVIAAALFVRQRTSS